MALSDKMMVREKRVSEMLMPLSAGETAYQGGMACIDTSSGEVVAGQASTTLIPIGWFAESKDNSGGSDTLDVNVHFFQELVVRFWDNDGGGSPATGSDVGSDCYIKDDATVSMSSATNSRSKAGIVLIVDSKKGVGVVRAL